jgi:putative ABC transport system permease protein
LHLHINHTVCINKYKDWLLPKVKAMLTYLPLIVRNLLRHRRRSVLTVASIAVSLCLLGVLLALYRALFYTGDTTPGQARRLVVHHKIALTQDLPLAYEATIAQTPGVQAVTSLRWFGGTYRDPGDPKTRFAQFAIEPKTLFAVYPEFHIQASEKQAFVSQKTACVASRDLANRLGWKLGERIPLVGTLLPVNLELTLAGIFDGPTGNPVLYFNADYLRDSLPAGDPRRDMVQQYYVEASGKDAVWDIARQIDDSFADSPYPTRSEPEQAFLLSFVSFLGNLKLFLAAISGAVTFTLLLISANMLSMSVRERTREVGILKTLGFTSGEILGMVAGEAGVIAVIGGLLGCLAAAGLCAAIAGAMRSAPGFVSIVRGLALSPFLVAVTLAAALVIGLASSVAPGLYAARISILEAIRYEG